ncbi:hypothetical protein ACFV7R_17600 [Streptomyces sp. NPDC059866]|uniref:hypothetical protein n=1 Tax=Streptomyces sp. NPDC059866 TaxID=3346978 RepID=UPI003662F48D
MLKVIDEIPDSVEQQGEAAVRAYLDEHLASTNRGVRGWWQTAKCVGSITAAIAGGAVPVAKILKLKAFIKKVGSVKEAAHLLIRVSKGEEKISELGATLGGLASVILGIDGIKRNSRQPARSYGSEGRRFESCRVRTSQSLGLFCLLVSEATDQQTGE